MGLRLCCPANLGPGATRPGALARADREPFRQAADAALASSAQRRSRSTALPHPGSASSFTRCETTVAPGGKATDSPIRTTSSAPASEDGRAYRHPRQPLALRALLDIAKIRGNSYAPLPIGHPISWTSDQSKLVR